MNEFEENHKPEQLFLKTSIDDYVSYKKDRKAYDKKYNALLKAVTKKENLLKSSLPVTNIWFITKDGKYAAGVEKNSTHLYSLKQVYYTDQPELTSRIALGTYLRDRMPRAIYPNDY
ncbi:MAG TPA: hypothetical protein PK776_11345 [Flavobacterium sp.]|nr:hypothetical protein [Flavobacterium sp.]